MATNSERVAALLGITVREAVTLLRDIQAMTHPRDLSSYEVAQDIEQKLKQSQGRVVSLEEIKSSFSRGSSAASTAEQAPSSFDAKARVTSQLDTAINSSLRLDRTVPPATAQPSGRPTTSWKSELLGAAREARIQFQWVDDVRQEAHARATIATLKAFGDNAGGFIYIEPCVRERSERPPDILLAHASVGIVVFEVKNWPIEIINDVLGGHIMVSEGGFVRSRNVFDQASRCMYQIKDATRRAIRQKLGTDEDSLMPPFNFFVVFPNIRESQWLASRHRDSLNLSQVLFAEQLERPKLLRERVEDYVSTRMGGTLQGVFLTSEQLHSVKRALGDSAVINEGREIRTDVAEELIGYEIDEFVALEKNLSSEQQELSRVDFAGRPQLVRGVAGSGKSVVLANNAARLVNRKIKEGQESGGLGRLPRVALVCYNRALVSFLREKTRAAFEQQTLEQPPDGTIECYHLNGLLFSLTDSPRNPNRGPLKYQHIGDDYSGGAASIAMNYRLQLEDLAQSRPETYDSLLYDAIYLDEGQDLYEEEFQVLMTLVRTHPETGEKNMVIFYDDAQNLYARPRPNWSRLGIDVVGGRRSRVMKECFRNSRQIVEFAFNVLLGAKAAPHIRVQTREYADVSYLKSIGLVEELEDRWKVNFAQRSYMAPEVHAFPSRQPEKNWVAEHIHWLVDQEGVRPEDILVTFEHEGEFADLEDRIRSRVRGIQGFVKPFGRDPANPDKDSYIFRKGHLTISTTKGAKGYDAPVVFLVGADQFENTREGRASFYVGATRAKMLLFVSGLNTHLSLVQEAEQVQQMLFIQGYR
jgi:superfamily I DNA and RNA helicase